MLTVRYCDVEGGEEDVYVAQGGMLNWWVGNFDEDPRFVVDDEFYHLTAESPCIDAGINEAAWLIDLPYFDFDGDPRIIDGDGNGLTTVDMGVDEFCLGNDADGDGYDDCEDCDDFDASFNPGAEEICDGLDNDCDGEIDDGATATYCYDADEDGFGDPSDTFEGCTPPEYYVDNCEDCDDSDPDMHPDATETRDDGIDSNCSCGGGETTDLRCDNCFIGMLR